MIDLLTKLTKFTDLEEDNGIIDDAKEHFRRGFSVMLPMENAFMHIGVFLGWVIERELYSELFADEGDTQIFRFLNQNLSCVLLGTVWDGCVSYEQLNEEGQEFARDYYEAGQYLIDYKETLAKDKKSLFQVKDNRMSYERMRDVLDQRFAEWLACKGKTITWKSMEAA